MQIGHHQIGGNNTVYIVAELSANHKQDFGRALRILQAAKAAGADAIKLQTYTPDSITLDSDRECFRIHGGTLWDGQTLHSLYAEASTPWEWHAKLQSAATDLALDFFSSPFDASAIGFLETLNVPAYKIASPELVDIGLIERAARTGKPLIMSTGMATREEIQEALETARRSGTKEIALLKCTSAYPAPVEEMNLRAIPEMADAFGLPVGLSDHTTGIAAPVAAVALGACIIEKHLTLARSDGGPDAAFSLEPDEFRTMVEAVRVAEKVLGSAYIGPQPRENASRAFRRSLFVVENMKSGTLFNSTNVRSIRPAHGLHPRYLPQVLGKSCTRDITRGTPLDWDLVKTNN
jgi:pseudaminic acid synthase